MNVHAYGFKLTKLSLYAPKMVKNKRSRMSFFVLVWLVLEGKKVGLQC